MSCKTTDWEHERHDDFMGGFVIPLVNRNKNRKYHYLFDIPERDEKYLPRGGGNWGPVQSSYAETYVQMSGKKKMCTNVDYPPCVISRKTPEKGVFYQPSHPNYPYPPYFVDTFYDNVPRSKWDMRC